MVKSLALLVFACALGSAYQEQPPPAKGSLAGIVTNVKTGSPLKKATVTLIPVSRAGSGNNSVDTDEQGRFFFRSLDAGLYRVSGSRQGFLPTSYGARKPGGIGTPVIVAEGQDVKDLAVTLMPQSVITGKVLDEDGDPVVNTMVRSMRNIYRNGKRQWFPTAGANTNDIGEYRIANLEPGRYILATNARLVAGDVTRLPAPESQSEEPERIYAATYYPSTLSASVAIPINVTPGDELRGIDIRLLKTSVFRVRGRVVGYSDPRPVAVMLTPRDNDLMAPLMAMTRGADFDFEIRGVLPGEYTAIAQSRSGSQLWVASEPIIVTGTNVDGVRLSVVEAAEIHGIVKVVDASAPPNFKNLSVSLMASATRSTAVTSPVREDMQFTLSGVSPMRQDIAVHGFPDTCYVQSIRYGGAEVPADGAEMHAGGTLEITLSCQAAQLDAVVTTQDDKVAPHAAFALVPKGGGAAIARITDENGYVSLRGLKPGDYQVFAWEDAEEGAQLDPDFRKPFESQAKSISIDPSAHASVQLKAIPAQ
jgi:hypothetical protein